MINDEMLEVKFESNSGRDEFIESVLNSVDNKISDEDLCEISKLLKGV